MVGSFSPSVNQCQGKSLDTPKLKFKRRIRMELDATGVPCKAVSIEAGLDPGFFSRAIRDEHDEAIHAHSLPAITRELGPGLMTWLAGQCGGTYQHGAEIGHIEAQPTVLIGLLAHESGDLIQQLIQDLADADWSPKERAARIPSLRKLHSIVESLLADAEGSFQ